MLEIRLLGSLEARDGDRDLTPRRLKQRALLATLALRVGEPTSADRLVEHLWGEEAPKSAKHALENYVSELRKALGGETIATRPAGYVLDIDREAVDVVRFERLVAELPDTDPAARAKRLREALVLVRGPPLADLAFEPFALTEAPRLQELELHAREALADAELELGNPADALLLLEPLVAAHPFRERLRAQQMVALYRSGRQADALAAYQDARRVLVEELGIDPGPELQDLERAILRQDEHLRPPPLPPGLSVPSAAHETPRPARKTVTVVVVELANSGALAERLDPEPLRAVLDRYLAAARMAVDRHRGVCGRLAGNAVVAAFGVPAAHEDDALRAVRAATELREAVGVLNDGLLPEHGVFLEVTTALSTGEALVGTAAEDPATGRAVAVAERLGRAAQPGQIVLGEDTYRLVRDVVMAEPVATDHDPGFRLVDVLPDAHGRTLRLDSPLVGRRRQLSTLASVFESTVSDGPCHLLTVFGAAGIGKSRLVREFLDDLGDVPLVLHGHCPPYGEGITYRPLVEAFREVGVDLERPAPTPQGVRRALEALALERPVVVSLDDLQWADPALLDLVESIVETSRTTPVLLICAARSELLEQRPSWSSGKPNATSLLLEPLTEAESERLLDNLLGESDLPDPVRDYIVSSADGSPLFVEELLATLVDRDLLRLEAGRWTTTEVSTIPLPPTIRALIASRIDRLPDDERTVLEVASIEGKVFELATVVGLAPAPVGADADLHVAALVGKEIIRPPAGGDELSFRHQAIRDAVYGSMPMQRRADLHDRLAARLEGASGDEELVRYHRAHAERYRSELGISSSPNRV
ncbi:MAG TPA: BTAD domain-containing putative transcriptional regulator [Gaiellaceae bacterium]|nr:BTAD domain-containing putative transcriptional regulator [Gaiellaceae bacterium]